MKSVILFVEIQDGELKGTRTPVREGMTFGRQGCDVNIQDPKVSAKHAEVELRPDGSFWLVDLGSANGIRSQKQKVTEVPLRHGLAFRLGRTNFLVQDMDASPDVDGPTGKASGPPAWFQQIGLLAEKGIKNSPVVNRQIRAFPEALRLRFTRGLQSGTEWFLGYGPRDVGGSSVDLPVFEPGAPAKCFHIEAGSDGAVLKVHSEALGKVLLNGRFVETSALKAGDMVDIGNSRIEIHLETKT